MMITVGKIIQAFETFCPPSWSEEGDPIGLHFGHPNREVHRILVTLDVRPEVVQEAVENDCDFIFSHHPVIFHRPKTLTEDDPQQRMYAEIIRHHLSVYSAHTNLDNAPGGMNDWLAELYGIQDTEVLVPKKPLTQDANNQLVGMGRIGHLEKPMTVRELAETIKVRHSLSGLRVVTNDIDQKIQRVAVLGGDGGDFYREALDKGAEAYITGDVYYHTAHDMLAAGLSVIDPGHHMESVCKSHLKQMFESWLKQAGYRDVTVVESSLNTDPFQFL